MICITLWPVTPLLSCVRLLPEGCAIGDSTSHATEKNRGTSHVHSTRTTGVRASCAAANVERAPGRARHVRGACARPPIADHVRCARVVSVRAQLTCASCADSLGTGCEVTFTRLTCGNSASYVSSRRATLALSLRCTASVNPLSRGWQQIWCRIAYFVSKSHLSVQDMSRSVSLSRYDVHVAQTSGCGPGPAQRDAMSLCVL